jgi:hypothetical protein
MALLAKDCGFVLEQVIYDSTEAQFFLSERYCRDIPLHANFKFLPSYMKRCKKWAKYLNGIQDGDQACFVLRK